MYVIKNNCSRAILIKDLNIKVESGKKMDLDSKYPRYCLDKSTDLNSLIKDKKILVLYKKDNIYENIYEQEILNVKEVYNKNDQDIISDDKKENSQDKISDDENNISDLSILKMIREDISDLKNSLKNIKNNSNHENHSSETLEKFADLQAKSLSGKIKDLDKNYQSIGNKTSSEDDDFDDLLNTLNNLKK